MSTSDPKCRRKSRLHKMQVLFGQLCHGTQNYVEVAICWKRALHQFIILTKFRLWKGGETVVRRKNWLVHCRYYFKNIKYPLFAPFACLIFMWSVMEEISGKTWILLLDMQRALCSAPAPAHSVWRYTAVHTCGAKQIGCSSQIICNPHSHCSILHLLLSCLPMAKPRLHCWHGWVGGCNTQGTFWQLLTPPLSISIASSYYEGSRPMHAQCSPLS